MRVNRHRIFSFFTLLIVLPLANSTSAQELFCGIKNTTAQHGEVLTYKIYYSLGGASVGAGEVTFTTQVEQYNNKGVFHFIGKGNTFKSYDWFYKVRDVYESYVDTTTMKPLKFIRNVREGNLRIYNQVLFNYETNQAISTDSILPIPSCIQDVLSAIYYARNINYSTYKKGDKIPLQLYLDNQVYPIYLRYQGKEKLKTKYGTYSTIKFNPLLIDGTIFKGGESMTVWVSDDAYRIPIFVRTPIVVGNIDVYLIKSARPK